MTIVHIRKVRKYSPLSRRSLVLLTSMAGNSAVTLTDNQEVT